MSFGRYSRNRRQGTVWIRALLACTALIGVLAARNVLPQFPYTLNAHSISSDSHHDQRPRFDNSGSKWSAPARSFLPTPAIAESPRLAPAPPLWSALQTKGFHFNRPPPNS
jgi:hypothetical protein